MTFFVPLSYILLNAQKGNVMIRKSFLMLVAVSLLSLSTTAFAANGYGNAGDVGQANYGYGFGLAGDVSCPFGDGTGLGLMLGFGDGTEPMPQDGTGFGAPINR